MSTPDLTQMEVVLVAPAPAARGIVFLHCMLCGVTQWARRDSRDAPLTLAELVGLAETHTACVPEHPDA